MGRGVCAFYVTALNPQTAVAGPAANVPGEYASYDPASGELIWEAAGLTENVIPMPVTGHGLVYVMSGFRGFSIQAIRLDAKGDVTDSPAIAWNVRRSAPYVPSPVLSGDRLYMIKSNDAFLSCLNALTGEVIYQDQRLEGLRGLYASPIAAGDTGRSPPPAASSGATTGISG